MTTAKTQDEFPGPEAQDDAWTALTRGELSKEEEAFLRALAEESEPDAARLEAHLPLGEDFRARTADKLANDLARQRRQKSLRLRVALTWGTASLAVAAAALFVILPRGPGLPEYTLAVHGTVAEARGAEPAATGTLRVQPQTELDVVLTPAAKVEGDTVLTVGLVTPDGLKIAQRPAERAPSGAFRLLGSVDELFGAVAPGRYQLLAVVGRKPLDAEELAGLAQQGDPGVEKVELVYEAPPAP